MRAGPRPAKPRLPASLPRPSPLAVAAAGSGADARFDYAARFGVAVPILSFTAAWNPSAGEQHDTPMVELTCVQTTAIQQYTIDPALCYDGGGAWLAMLAGVWGGGTACRRPSDATHHCLSSFHGGRGGIKRHTGSTPS